MTSLELTELLNEESFSDVRKQVRHLKWSKKNKAVLILTATISVAFLVITYFAASISMVEKVEMQRQLIKELSGLAIVYSAALLGFLIAGFAIFTSSDRDGFFKKLALNFYPGIDRSFRISQFKFVFFSYLNALSNHLYLLFLAVFMSVIAGPASVSFSEISGIFKISNDVIFIFNSAIFLVLVFYFSIAAMNIKAFVWNLYQVTVLQINVAAKEEQEAP